MMCVLYALHISNAVSMISLKTSDDDDERLSILLHTHTHVYTDKNN